MMDRKYRHILSFAIGLGILIILLGSVNITDLWAQSDDEISQKQRELEQIQKQIAEEQARREKLVKQERNIQQELQSIDRELKLAEKLVLDYNWIVYVTNKQIKRLEAEIDTLNVRLAERQTVMSRRLRHIFMSGKYSFLEVLLSADSFADMIERYEFLKLVAEQDHVLYEQIQADQAAKQAKQLELEQKVADAREMLTQKRQQEQRIESRHQERRSLLSQVRNDKTQYEKMIDELKAAARRIENFFASLERKRQGKLDQEDIPDIEQSDHYLYKNRGKIAWPVSGNVIEGYGRKIHPKYKTETFNKGIDIEASKGRTVKAIYSGKVVFADWFSGYGKLVIIDHGGGFYSLYAHLDQINTSVNAEVGSGNSIGTVGETGSTKGPHLHFEIRYRDKTYDPRRFLK